MKKIRQYLDKNLFYVSVLITGLTSFFIGIFYSLFKDFIFKQNVESFLEGTGVMGSYITESTGRPSEINYFVIVFIISLLFFFVISFVLSKFLNKKYLYVFNLVSLLNVIFLIGFMFSSLFISFSLVFTVIFLVFILLVYLFVFYKVLDEIFNFDFNKNIKTLLIFNGLIIIILILFKFFV